MANPFKEAEKAKKKPAGNPKGSEEVKEVSSEPGGEEVVEKPVVQKSEKAKVEKQTVEKEKVSLFAGLTVEKEAAHTCAFYLTDKNVEKLKKMAETQGVSASKLLDHILSEVL